MNKPVTRHHGAAGPPPALTSPAYTRDFNEIKSVGSAASTTRTPEQTTTARFWSLTGTQE